MSAAQAAANRLVETDLAGIVFAPAPEAPALTQEEIVLTIAQIMQDETGADGELSAAGEVAIDGLLAQLEEPPATFCGGKGGTKGPCPEGGGDVPGGSGAHNPAEIEVASPAAEKSIGDSYSGLTEVSQTAGQSFDEIVHSDADQAEKVDEVYAKHDEIAEQASGHMDDAADDTLSTLRDEYTPEDEGDLEDFEGDWPTIEEDFGLKAGAAKEEFLGVLGAQRDAAEEYALDPTPEGLAKVQGTQGAVDAAAETWMGKVREAAQKVIESVAGVYNNNDAGRKNYSEEPTVFRFDEAKPLEPMPPLQALDYFRRLYPRLGIDPERWGPLWERQSFTLAKATDSTMLSRVQDIIAGILAEGDSVRDAQDSIEEILDAAGVGGDNGAYAENVVRTNLMDSYNTGGERQRMESLDVFPAWQMSNPNDGRSRRKHADRDKKYYPGEVSFFEVRGTADEDIFQCRCVPIAIDRYSWQDLQKAGARVEVGPPW